MTTFATLFTGIGGWDEGLRRAGMTPLWGCEIATFPRRVLAKRYPDMMIYPDVSKLRGADVERPDVLVASPPCQDLSVAGKRAGFAGARSGLFFDFARLAGELQPAWILMEQVPGLLSSNERRDFDVALSTLDELGFGMAWRTLDARYFGVPQRRRRIYLVGRFGAPCPAEVFFESEGGDGDLAAGESSREDPAAEVGSGVARSLRARPNASHREDSDTYIPEVAPTMRAGKNRTGGDRPPGTDVDTADSLIVSGTVRSHTRPGSNDVGGIVLAGTIGGGDYGGGRHPSNLYPNLVHSLTSGGADASEDGTGRGTPLIAFRKSARMNADPNSPETWVDDGIANTLNSFDVGDVRTTHAIVAATLSRGGGPSGEAGRRHEDDENIVISARLSRNSHTSNQFGVKTDGLHDSLSTDGPGSVRTASSVRRLTPTECERLMGFPDGWTCLCDTDVCSCPDGPRYAALGNAVVVNKSEWIGKRIAAVMSEQ